MTPVPVMGVDGCRGGWVAVTLGAAITWSWTGLAETAALLDGPADVVAIDIPIGLPDVGPRACDRQARARLPGRSACVFPAPRRLVLRASSYGEARAALRAAGGPSMSAQAWGIVAPVRAVDAAIGPADEARIVEAHPELAFATMAGSGPLPPKTSAAGRQLRRELLTAWRPDAVTALDRSGLPGVDGLDALACAWVAERWRRCDATVLGDGARDGRGLLMRIAA